MDPNTERHCLPLLSSLLPPHTDFLCLSCKAGRTSSALNTLMRCGAASTKRVRSTGTAPSSGWAAHRHRSDRVRGEHVFTRCGLLAHHHPARHGGCRGRWQDRHQPRRSQEQDRHIRPPLRRQPLPLTFSTPCRTSCAIGHGRARQTHVDCTRPPFRPPADRAPAQRHCPLDGDAFSDLILESVAIKGDIVAQDPTESTGTRKQLNLGHTAGHAFESWALSEGHDLLHGEAVAWGPSVSSWPSQLVDPVWNRKPGRLLR